MNLDVGIVVPVHRRDMGLFPVFADGLKKAGGLSCHTGFNDGVPDLGVYVKKLLEEFFAFERGFDVAVKLDVDFYIFPDLFKHVDSDRVTSFAVRERIFQDVPRALLNLFYPYCWTGLYSIPRKVFEEVKDEWNGLDGDLHRLVKHNYKFVKRPMYYGLRCSKRLFDHRIKMLKI